MTDNVLSMAKEPKKPKRSRQGKKPFPSRLNVKYVQIPKEYWQILDGLTADGAKYEDRSVAYLAKIAVRKFLQDEGKLDEKGKPKGEGA